MQRQKAFTDGIKTVLLFFMATGIGMLFKKLEFTDPNIVVVYLFAVLLTARVTDGYGYGIVASIIALLGFNYFFTEPFLTFAVNDTSYLTTFAIMTITSIVTSTLTSKTKALIRVAKQKEMESRLLYHLSSSLQNVDSMEEIVEIAVKHMSELLGDHVIGVSFSEEDRFLLDSENGQIQRDDPEMVIWEQKFKKIPQKVSEQQVEEEEKTVLGQLPEDKRKNVLGQLSEEKEKIASGRAAVSVETDSYTDWPIRGHNKVLGMIRTKRAENWDSARATAVLFESMLDNITIAMDRIAAVNERMKDREMITRERDRANLLRAISHDLRTPLSGILGTAEILLNLTESQDQRYPMLQGIYQDAGWLYSMVNNILSLTRLKDGNILIHKEMEALEEVIACAAAHIEKLRPGREIQVELPEEFRLVPMDARLIEQVITNLLDNAVKHTPPEKEICISVAYKDSSVCVAVKDQGEGIPECDIDHIFQMFYTTETKTADASGGVGLGLAICETVIKAHGGKIYAGNRTDCQGAVVQFELPLKEGKTIV